MASLTSTLNLLAPSAPSPRANISTSARRHLSRPTLATPATSFLSRRTPLQGKALAAPGRALGHRSLAPRANKDQFVEGESEAEDSARETADRLKESTQGAAEDVKSGAQEAGAGLQDRAEGAGEYLGARADEARAGLHNRAGAAGDYLGERVDEAREAAGGAGKGLQDAGEDVAKTAVSGFDQARAAVQNLAGSLFGRAKEASQEARGQGQGAWDSAKGVAGELSGKVQSGAGARWEGAKATSEDVKPPSVPIERQGGSMEKESPAGNTTAGSGKEDGKAGAGGTKLNLQQQRETEPEQLRTAVSGDVKGWTGSGDFSADDAEKRGMSEGEYLAARLVDRADKESP